MSWLGRVLSNVDVIVKECCGGKLDDGVGKEDPVKAHRDGTAMK